jgi:hypothetical protein
MASRIETILADFAVSCVKTVETDVPEDRPMEVQTSSHGQACPLARLLGIHLKVSPAIMALFFINASATAA